jgi:hypothetical protein
MVYSNSPNATETFSVGSLSHGNKTNKKAEIETATGRLGDEFIELELEHEEFRESRSVRRTHRRYVQPGDRLILHDAARKGDATPLRVERLPKVVWEPACRPRRNCACSAQTARPP